MSSVSERYDRAALDYVRYWGPVLTEAARRLLEECDAHVRAAIGAAKADPQGRPPRLLDLGAGTGTLSLDALRRWPQLHVLGIDASSGMLGVAQRDAERLPAEMRGRLRFMTASADALPLPDASVDVCVSSFVLQLVPDRGAALREVLRVLRPGGRLGFVTWIDEEAPFEAADAFDDVVAELDIEEPEDDRGDEEVSGDFTSPEAAVEELEAAGFDEVSARRDRLEYRWSLESYLDYKEHYGERGLFGSLRRRERDLLRRQAGERLRTLDSAAFRWRTPVVYAWGRRPLS